MNSYMEMKYFCFFQFLCKMETFETCYATIIVTVRVAEYLIQMSKQRFEMGAFFLIMVSVTTVLLTLWCINISFIKVRRCLFVCENHFLETDHEFTVAMRLQATAVPKVQNPIQSMIQTESNIKVQNLNISYKNIAF